MSTKAYLGYRASLDWLAGVAEVVTARPGLADAVTVFVAPSFPVLESAGRILAGTGVVLGAQNCGEQGGAFTGEVSAEFLAELGVGLVEIGHAERRRLFGETDAVVARKTAAAAGAGLTSLLCIGEAERGSPADAAEFCFAQVLSALADQVPLSSAVIAYEPEWAIGAAESASPDYANDVVDRLRERLAGATGERASIIYGGSAKPGLLPRLAGVDGLFLGRFAHDPAQLALVLDEALARSSLGG